jgi:hypothetical protein
MGAGVVLQGLQQQGVACARIATGRGHLKSGPSESAGRWH